MSAFRLLTVAAACLTAVAVAARAGGADRSPTPDRGFLSRTYQGADGREVKYVVFVPHDYTPDRPVPAILFLHGAGEAGTDGERQVRVGLGKAIRARESTFPFLVVFPQAQKRRPTVLDTWFPNTAEGGRALAIFEEVRKQYATDPKRLYLTGMSMGGFGTWAMAAAFPDRWAAIAPVCGGGDPACADKVKDLP